MELQIEFLVCEDLHSVKTEAISFVTSIIYRQFQVQAEIPR